jgi:muconate cycloisomerase
LRSVLDAAGPEVTNARVPIEMACVDLAARCFGVPVHTYLGGAVTERLEFNAWIGLLPPQEAAAEAARWLARGFRSAKIKVSGGVEADFERIEAVRGAVGSAMALRIDANESYDAATSIKLAKMVRRFDIEHFEQPAPSGDLEGLARVRREGGIAVMADESITDHASLIAVIKADAADIVKLGVKEQGGLHRMAELIATAEAAGIRCVVGHGFGLAPSTLAEIAVAATSRNVMAGLECVGPLKTKDTVTKTGLDISSGSLPLPAGPGLGIELDDEKLKRYALHH